MIYTSVHLYIRSSNYRTPFFEKGILSLREKELPYVRLELRLFAYLMTMTVALPQVGFITYIHLFIYILDH